MNEKLLISKVPVYVVKNIDELPPICVDDNNSEPEFVRDK